IRSPAHRRAGGRHLPALLPSASPSPCSDVPGAHQPAPPQLLVQPAPEVAAVLDFHALDGDVNGAKSAAIQRHHGLRPCLANQGERGAGDDATVLERGNTGWSGLKNGALDAVAMRDIADEAAKAF